MKRWVIAATFAIALSGVSMAEEQFTADDFRPMLAMNADAGRYDAGKLADIGNKFVPSMGKDGAFAFITQGIRLHMSEMDMVEMRIAVLRSSIVYKWSPRSAEKRLLAAFYGSIDDLKNFDREVNYLSADQWADIRNTFDADPRAARAKAFKIYSGKLASAVPN